MKKTDDEETKGNKQIKIICDSKVYIYIYNFFSKAVWHKQRKTNDTQRNVEKKTRRRRKRRTHENDNGHISITFMINLFLV